MNGWLIVLITLLIVSLINTIIVILVDYANFDDIIADRIMIGVVGWLLCLLGFIVNKIKRHKERKNVKDVS